MSEQLLALLVFTSGILCLVLRESTAVPTVLEVDSKPNKNPISVFEDSIKLLNRSQEDVLPGLSPSVTTMNGENIYHANQQVFYLNWPPQSTTCQQCNCTSVLTKDDYVVAPGIGAHKLHTRKLSWNRARKSCIDEGGYLAIPNSLAEEAVLIKWMLASKVDTAWLGIHDLFEEGDWVTLTGESLEKSGYDRWTPAIPTDPDNFGGNQNCAILLSKHGGMDDIGCGSSHAYFCEITMC
ncbi:hemolymph lipopolysaccharide-binding protein-like isoform X1 [Colletes latitarsis]|uniref:hemolymph lipopolysaccharide-binding protein-like isoform X1 n=1 Tax=Colletes latitarsis TaxID=2605962 RepID=UPI004035E7ED